MGGVAGSRGNFVVNAAVVADRAALDYRLLPGSAAVNAGAALDPQTMSAMPLLQEYVHPRAGRDRADVGAADAGAHGKRP